MSPIKPIVHASASMVSRETGLPTWQVEILLPTLTLVLLGLGVGALCTLLPCGYGNARPKRVRHATSYARASGFSPASGGNRAVRGRLLDADDDDRPTV